MNGDISCSAQCSATRKALPLKQQHAPAGGAARSACWCPQWTPPGQRKTGSQTAVSGRRPKSPPPGPQLRWGWTAWVGWFATRLSARSTTGAPAHKAHLSIFVRSMSRSAKQDSALNSMPGPARRGAVPPALSTRMWLSQLHIRTLGQRKYDGGLVGEQRVARRHGLT